MKSKIPLQNLSHHYEEECSDDATDLKKIHKSVCTRITNIVKKQKSNTYSTINNR